MKRLVIFLFFASMCYGTPLVLLDTTYADVYTSHQLPATDNTLDVGSDTLFWHFFYGNAFTDGTAYWESNQLYGFSEIDADSIVAHVDLYGLAITGVDITGTTLTDGVLSINSGSITSAVDGTFLGTLTGTTITDGTFVVTGGIITSGIWRGTAIDISDYTNLVAGTNITLVDDTLNVDDAFLINDGDDTTTGTLTAGNLTTAGTATTDILIVGSNPPATAASAGIAGTITYDNDYIYVAIANNTWERTAIATWAIATENVIYAAENVIYAAEQVVYP